MPTISPSELLRVKKLQIITNNIHNAESTTGISNRLANTLPIRLTAINSSVVVPPTPSQKNFTTGKTISPITHVKF